MTLKIHSTEAERLAEYRICQERGHQYKDTDYYHPLIGSWKVCKWCGTHFVEKTTVETIESNKPEGAE